MINEATTAAVDDGNDDQCYWDCDGTEEHCDHLNSHGACCECGAGVPVVLAEIGQADG